MMNQYNNITASTNTDFGIRFELGMDNLFYVILLVVCIIEFNSDFKEIVTIRYAAMGILFVQLMLFCFGRRKITFGYYTKWSLIMFIAYAASTMWCLNKEFSIQMLKNIVIEMLFVNTVIMVTKDRESHEKLMKAVYYALIFNVIYVIARIGIGNVGEMRLGREYKVLELWDDNYIGYLAAFGAMFSYYYAKKSGGIKKTIYLFLFVYCCFVNLSTGSRGALIIIVGFWMVDYYLTGRGLQKFKRIVWIMAGILVLLYAIYNNNALYNIIGVRIDRFIQTITGTGVRENSTSQRIFLLTYGFKWFTQKPILGYGLDSFRTLFYNARGILYYAHNNYLELLVDLGILGTAIYYALYVNLIRRYRHSVFKEQDYDAIFFFSLLIMIMVSEFVGITYYVALFQMMLVTIFSYSRYLPIGSNV